MNHRFFSNKKIQLKVWVLHVLFFFLSIFLLCLNSADAQSVPQLVNYQGMLTDAGGQPLPTQEYNISFSIYTTATGGTAVWGPQIFDGNAGTGHGAKVPVVQGHFNVILGQVDTSDRSISEAFVSEETYLEITVNGGSPITPRQRILSTPYALNGVPAGMIGPYAGQNVPKGWLLCNGAAVNSQDYPALYAAIGTSWGNGSDDSDPNTDFNLPDLGGRFLRGVDSSAEQRDPDRDSRTASKPGGNTGNSVGSVQEDATKRPNEDFTTNTTGSHRHAILVNKTLGSQGSTTWAGSGSPWTSSVCSDAGNHSHTISGGGDNETRPINAYVNWIIKF